MFYSLRVTSREGTRQGCPLSHFLFGILIKPLSTASWQNRNINCIHTISPKQKLSVYSIHWYNISSNNILPSPKPPITLLTEAIALSLHRRQQSKHTGTITCLGINMSFQLSRLFILSFNLLLRTIDNELPPCLTFPYLLLAIIKVTTHPEIGTSFLPN